MKIVQGLSKLVLEAVPGGRSIMWFCDAHHTLEFEPDLPAFTVKQEKKKKGGLIQAMKNII